MTAMSKHAPTRGGVQTTGTAVTATDTLNRSLLGQRGCLVEVINGNASANTVTVSDASTTKTGALAQAVSRSIPAGQSYMFVVKPEMADPVTRVVTFTHSVTPTVTYKVFPLDL